MDGLHRKRFVLRKKKKKINWFSVCKYQNQNQVALFECKWFISVAFFIENLQRGTFKSTMRKDDNQFDSA